MLWIDYSPKADAMYLHFSDQPVIETKEITPDLVVDLAADGTLVGIDVQRVSELLEEVSE